MPDLKGDYGVQQSVVGRLLSEAGRWTTGPQDPTIKNVGGTAFEGMSFAYCAVPAASSADDHNIFALMFSAGADTVCTRILLHHVPLMS